VAWLEAGIWQRCLWLAAAVFGAALAYFATLLAAGLRPSHLRMPVTG
jgi:hypothetical protein